MKESIPKAYDSFIPRAYNASPKGYNIIPSASNILPSAYNITPKAYRIIEEVFIAIPLAYSITPRAYTYTIIPKVTISSQVLLISSQALTKSLKGAYCHPKGL